MFPIPPVFKDDKAGWLRLVLAFIIGGFVVGAAWNNIKATLINHTEKIVKLEESIKTIPAIRESLARIEGALGIIKK